MKKNNDELSDGSSESSSNNNNNNKKQTKKKQRQQQSRSPCFSRWMLVKIWEIMLPLSIISQWWWSFTNRLHHIVSTSSYIWINETKIYPQKMRNKQTNIKIKNERKQMKICCCFFVVDEFVTFQIWFDCSIFGCIRFWPNVEIKIQNILIYF